MAINIQAVTVGPKKGCQHKIHKQRYAECCSGNQILQSGSHVLAVGHFGVQIHCPVIVYGQLEQAEIYTACNKYSPTDAAQYSQFAGCHSRYHQEQGDEYGDAVQNIFGTQQCVDGLLAAHQPSM